MSNAFIFFVMVAIIAVIAVIRNVRKQKREVEIVDEPDTIDTSIRRPWTEEEFVVLAFYVLYEKAGDDDVNLIETIATGMSRSVASVKKKMSIFNNIESTEEHLHKLERTVYNNLKKLGYDLAENELDEAVIKIVNANPQ